MENKDVNVLNSTQIKIENNVIEMDDSIIQISNVASVSLRYPPKEEYKPYMILGILIGLALLKSSNEITGSFGVVIGLVLIACCAYFIYKTWKRNEDLGKNIIISTSSGYYFWINSKDDKFSLQVIDVIRYLMNHPGSKEKILVNLDKLNIVNNGNIIQGDVSNSSMYNNSNVKNESTHFSDIHNSNIGDNNNLNVGNTTISDVHDANIGDNNSIGKKEPNIPDLRI